MNDTVSNKQSFRFKVQDFVLPEELQSLAPSDKLLVDSSALCATVHELTNWTRRQEMTGRIRGLYERFFAVGDENARIEFGTSIEMSVDEIRSIFGSEQDVPLGILRKAPKK